MNRRQLLMRLLGGSVALAAADIWIPGERSIFLPPVSGWADWRYWSVDWVGKMKDYSYPIHIFGRSSLEEAMELVRNYDPASCITNGGPRITVNGHFGLHKEYHLRDGALMLRS